MILLPSRAPELNPVENIWQYLRQNWLSNRVFDLRRLAKAHRKARDHHLHRTSSVKDKGRSY